MSTHNHQVLVYPAKGNRLPAQIDCVECGYAMNRMRHRHPPTYQCSDPDCGAETTLTIPKGSKLR